MALSSERSQQGLACHASDSLRAFTFTKPDKRRFSGAPSLVSAFLSVESHGFAHDVAAVSHITGIGSSRGGVRSREPHYYLSRRALSPHRWRVTRRDHTPLVRGGAGSSLWPGVDRFHRELLCLHARLVPPVRVRVPGRLGNQGAWCVQEDTAQVCGVCRVQEARGVVDGRGVLDRRPDIRLLARDDASVHGDRRIRFQPPLAGPALCRGARRSSLHLIRWSDSAQLKLMLLPRCSPLL